MKRLLTATLALTLLAGTAASAQPHGNDRHDDRGRHEQNRYDNDRGARHDNGNHYGQQKRWARGQRLPASYYRDRGHYVDYRRHHLRAPPRGYQWVQVDNNYAMVALASGLIASIIAAN